MASGELERGRCRARQPRVRDALKAWPGQKRVLMPSAWPGQKQFERAVGVSRAPTAKAWSAPAAPPVRSTQPRRASVAAIRVMSSSIGAGVRREPMPA